MQNFNHYNPRGQNNRPARNMAARYRATSPANHQQRNQNSFSQGWPPQSFSQPPPGFSAPPPPQGCGWDRGPPPPFSIPPPGFSGHPPTSGQGSYPGSNPRPPKPHPHQSGPPGHGSNPSQPLPLFGSPPPFSVPPPPFHGLPPYSGQSQRFSGPSPFSGQGSNSGPRPQRSNSGFQRSNSGSDPSPFQKRPVNNVWSDSTSSMFYPEQKFSGQASSSVGRGNQGSHSQRGMCNTNRGRGGGRGGGRDGRQQFQQGQGQSQVQGNNKKKKGKERQDSSDNDKFLCEVCDRGFKTEEKYQQHVDEHTKCFVEGCPYVAAPKLVQLHYQTQHKTGLAKKIWSMESPEDIKKWIEERKRNYPTAENKARKSRQETERRARGEVIENKQFGNMRGRGRGGRGHRGHGGRGRGHFRGKRHHQGEDHPSESTQESNADRLQGKRSPSKSETTEKRLDPEATDSGSCAKKRKVEISSDADENKSVEAKDPLSQILNGDEDRDSDDVNDNKPVTTNSNSNALTSLVTSYDLSDKEEDLAEGDEVSKTTESKATNGRRDEEGEGMKEKEETDEWKNGEEESKARWRKREPDWKRLNRRLQSRRSKKNTLLERLLADEVRHERNVLLQCVHFIVNNNFLGVLNRDVETIGK